MNIKDLKHIHFTGIKGVGMTSLALCVKDLGIKVTGSDVAEEFITDEILKKNGVEWSVGFGEQNLNPKPDLVITTGAHGGFNNPEVLKAKELGIPVMSHAEALAAITEGKEVIAVCGVGGKTTTCAMIATILEHAGLSPSWAIGVSDIPSLPAPGKYNKEGKYFVVEADEYAISPGVDNRPRFSLLHPKYIVLTNLKHDHPDIYPTFQDTEKAFAEFFSKLDDKGNLITKDSFKIKNITFAPQKTIFEIDDTKITLQVPGEFNALNAASAFTLGKHLGIDAEKLKKGLEEYKGCKRRFEKIAEVNNILLYDDYAHHPSEIEATLKAAREWFPDNRILVYFQPHTYSRTKALFQEFATSFNSADFVGIADIFSSAREEKDPEVTSEKLVDEIKKHHPHPENVGYAGDWNEGANYLAETLKPGDILITIGAGDIYKLHKLILEKLKNA